MKIEEIYRIAARDEFLTKFLHRFKNAVQIGKIKDFLFYKKIEQGDIFYGLFDENKNLVAMLWLTKYDTNKYQVATSQVIDILQKQGLGTALYVNAILKDKLTILSDTRHTLGSEKVWDRLRQMKSIRVLPYDLESNKIIKVNKKTVYANKQSIVWIVFENEKQNEKNNGN